MKRFVWLLMCLLSFLGVRAEVQWNYNPMTHVLHVYGEGKMKDFSSSYYTPWKDHRAVISTVIIGDGVTSIGRYAFADCKGIKEVRMSNSVTSIGYDAFINCVSLKRIYVSSQVRDLTSYQFENCKSLKEVVLLSPRPVTISSGAFRNIKNKIIVRAVVTPSLQSSSLCENLSIVDCTLDDALYLSYGDYYDFAVIRSLNEWKKQGRYENDDAYLRRVNEATIRQKEYELASAADKRYIQFHQSELEWKPVLSRYDADNETFKLTDATYGTIELNIPRDNNEAKNFKQNFDKRKVMVTWDTFNKKIVPYEIKINVPGCGEQIYVNSLVRDKRQLLRSLKDAMTVSDEPESPMLKLDMNVDTMWVTDTRLRLKYNVFAQNISQNDLYVDVRVNGRLYPRDSIDLQRAVLHLPDEEGTFSIQVGVHDRTNVYNDKQEVLVHYARPNVSALHILSVGVSPKNPRSLGHLQYTEKDAKDFALSFTRCAEQTGSYNGGIYPTILTGEEATYHNIMLAFDSISNVSRKNDVIVLYFSGHGNEAAAPYFVAYDWGGGENAGTISFDKLRNRAESFSTKNGCHVLLFVDACFSGAMAAKGGSHNDLLQTAPGVIGFYSCAAGEKSKESVNEQHGVFTKALLDALSGKAFDASGELTCAGLETYLLNNIKVQSPKVDNVGSNGIVIFRNKNYQKK